MGIVLHHDAIVRAIDSRCADDVLCDISAREREDEPLHRGLAGDGVRHDMCRFKADGGFVGRDTAFVTMHTPRDWATQNLVGGASGGAVACGELGLLVMYPRGGNGNGKEVTD